MGKHWPIKCRREHCGGSSLAVKCSSRLGGLVRNQISARMGARQSNRWGNLSRGVFLTLTTLFEEYHKPSFLPNFS